MAINSRRSAVAAPPLGFPAKNGDAGVAATGALRDLNFLRSHRHWTGYNSTMRLPVVEVPSTKPPMLESGPRSISNVQMLRISVTDRCNFRCVYCMPESGVRWLPKENLLGFEEIAAVVRAAVDIHGIRWIKLTGGEPTVRHGLTDLVRLLRRIDGLEELSMTTNGMRLMELAGPLKESGLDRITISIDSLKPDRFAAITRTGDLAQVMRGMERVADAGFTGTKINCVAMRGSNDDEFADFARLTRRLPVTVRFIEYMPLGDSALMHEDERGPAGGCGAQSRGEHAFISEADIRSRIEDELGELIPVDRSEEPGVGPAKVYRLRGDAVGRIGFISAMSAPFCSTCNRLRLTAEGVLRSCLFEGGEVDIRELVRGGGDANAIADAMTECVKRKPVVHSYHGNEQMSRIGG
jgi:cyclic pyranopterin phosphate synthase